MCGAAKRSGAGIPVPPGFLACAAAGVRVGVAVTAVFAFGHCALSLRYQLHLL